MEKVTLEKAKMLMGRVTYHTKKLEELRAAIKYYQSSTDQVLQINPRRSRNTHTLYNLSSDEVVTTLEGLVEKHEKELAQVEKEFEEL